MTVHDGTRVSQGTFHDFHGRWITPLTESLNAGRLPSNWYVPVPLDSTYNAAWRGVRERWRKVIEPSS
jgi:hypothetical protein